MKPDPKILKFIAEHHVFTLATCSKKIPWCSTMFYVFDEKQLAFYFTSDDQTRHASEMKENDIVSGAIALETKITGRLRGLQFSGRTHILLDNQEKIARKAYLKKFPVARLHKLNLWSLDIDYFKYTDNRLGFGKKLIWKA
ncbi:MAG: pyridoxamine 5'-phosphate oxidase family protein [Bacteroidota bacterium]